MHLIQTVGSQPREVSRVRHLVADALHVWGVTSDDTDVVVLLTSELVTNAIRYGSPPVVVHVDLDAPALVVAVDDGDVDRAVAARVQPVDDVPWDAGGGRGLQLVESLSDRWGVLARRQGKRVWFELHLA
ncbi:ATP-binding protein [Angustibacter aerolatus]